MKGGAAVVMYGVFLILVLIVTGGAIAFIGDRLGSKIGKKRLSILGLRPRHTSILITILTGVCITTLTFGVMAAASENVRTALFGLERLNQTIRETETSLEQTSSALASVQAEQKKTNDDLLQSKAEVDKLESQQAELQERSQVLAEGNRQLEAAKQELTQRNDELAKTNDELGTRNASLMTDNDVLTTSNQKLASDKKALEKQSDELRNGIRIMREGDIVYRAGEVIASGVVRGARDIKDVQADMETLAQLANRNVLQRLGQNAADKEVWIYQPEYEKAVETIAASPQDMVVRIVAAGNLVRGEPVRAVLQLYKNSIIYQRNEFIIARPFKLSGQGSAEAEQVVMSFLQDVNEAAAARGILPDPIRGSVGVMEGSQFYDIVQTIAPLQGTVMLSAYARGDTDALGPLRLNLRVETEKP